MSRIALRIERLSQWWRREDDAEVVSAQASPKAGLLQEARRRVSAGTGELTAVVRWGWTQLRKWWMGPAYEDKRAAAKRARQKQRQKEILRRLRGVA